MHFWKRLVEIVSPFFCVTIVSTTILYWTNITLSKMAAFDKWYQKPEIKAKLASTKKNAWEQFTKQFANADKDQFFVQESVDEKYKISAEVFYWSQKEKTALGLIGVEGFPFQLSPLKIKKHCQFQQ